MCIIKLMLRFAVFSIVLMAAITTAQNEVRTTPCANPGKGKLRMLTATPCHSDPCEIKKGGVTTFDFVFVPDMTSTTFRVDAYVSIMGFTIRIPGIEPDLCKAAVRCPINKDEPVIGGFNMSVPKVPIRRTVVEVKITGDHGMMSCFTHSILLA
ncbi:mite group 2 allergen Der f 2-like [Varroa jacobsoni]|nr:mite group 2 allergen Der f 2-like [Varroa jacobsoni]